MLVLVLVACAILTLVPIIAVQLNRAADPKPLNLNPFYGASRTPSIANLDGESSPRQSHLGLPLALRPGRTATVHGHEGGNYANVEDAAGEEAYGRTWQKKPWDPPFPTSVGRLGTMYRALPPTATPLDELRRGTERVAASGAASTAPASKSQLHSSSPPQSPRPPRLQPQTQPEAAPTPAPQPPPPPPGHTQPSHSSRPTYLQITLLLLAFLLLIVLFAVLTAHFLAGFLVYRTEARLGEARKGIMRGGEMRMCLCPR
ncbi:hypothetical protein BDV95DRAFT_398243 [Massariosphaeria phaeospora]|uniref:SUR7/PalI family-domain-containing protein n=1 Tax=Massariosphaeria phaeospora TaxID=100035 RepID=A0A7C8MGL6_9PLEO|nr:hypothetical protein BDV95DRAFT_398243 [Massariosphaeria phaeospora]